MQLTTIIETKKRANKTIYVYFLCVERCLRHPNYLDVINTILAQVQNPNPKLQHTAPAERYDRDSCRRCCSA